MIVRVLGALLPRVFVGDLGHFEPWHGEVNRERNFDGVSFDVTFGIRRYDLEQRNADQISQRVGVVVGF